MKTIIISIAHVADCADAAELIAKGEFPQGAVNGSYNEYDFSKTISERVASDLRNLSVPVRLFDASERFSHLKRNRINAKKIDIVNELVKRNRINAKKIDIVNALGADCGDCVAVEIHHNSVRSSGYSCHYYAGSKRGRSAAIAVCERFAGGRWSFPHWTDRPLNTDYPGVIGRPGGYGGGVFFLSDTHCPAIIIEAEGMKNAAWVAENWEMEAELIRSALCRIAGGVPW